MGVIFTLHWGGNSQYEFLLKWTWNAVSSSKQAINNSQKQPKSRILSNQSRNMNFLLKHTKNKSQKLWFSRFNIKVWISPQSKLEITPQNSQNVGFSLFYWMNEFFIKANWNCIFLLKARYNLLLKSIILAIQYKIWISPHSNLTMQFPPKDNSQKQEFSQIH